MSNHLRRFPNETSDLIMVFSMLGHERVKWREVRMRPHDARWKDEAAKALDREPIRLGFAVEMLVTCGETHPWKGWTGPVIHWKVHL